MSRAFTEEEKEAVRLRLKEEAREMFSRFGLKKTTVDELAKAAGIAKGSFYLFFPSKEELYYDLLEEEEAVLQGRIMVLLQDESMSRRERLKRVVTVGLNSVEESPFLRVMLDPGEMGLLLRKLPPERLKGHLEGDSNFAAGVVASLAGEDGFRGIPTEVVAGAFRGLFLLASERKLVGEQVAEQVLAFYVDALTSYLLPEEDNR